MGVDWRFAELKSALLQNPTEFVWCQVRNPPVFDYQYL